MVKRIMRRFSIDEISAVDRPAQANARAVIMKRYQERDSKLGSVDELIEKCGAVAEETIQLRAEVLRNPNLTEAQAFARGYTDPANAHLRMAERNKNGCGRGRGHGAIHGDAKRLRLRRGGRLVSVSKTHMWRMKNVLVP